VTETWWTTVEPRLRITRTRPSSGATRPPVLMLHGLWHAGWAWENWSARLAERGYDCHAVDLRGHGGSQGDVRTARLRDFIEDARRTVAAFPEPPILIGHSLGGALVERLLATDIYPAAVLVAGVPGRYPVRTVIRTAMASPGATARTLRRGDLHPLVDTVAGARQFLFGPGAAAETVRRTHARLASAAPHLIHELMVTRSPHPLPTTPTLVLAASHDAAFRPASQRRRAMVINADYIEIKDSGHDIQLDSAWREAADAVIQWLVTQRPSRPEPKGLRRT
jgi:pimeloyl-ACP methyl ester carboxylesterase